MSFTLRDRALAYVRRNGLLQAGDRLGLGVSGGADSVALLRLMLELQDELGAIISVIHFNHRIRGTEADADEHFVGDLAERFGLQFHCSSGDVPAHAAAQGLSLETAARELRYGCFSELLRRGMVTKIATAHTLDDQAETVLQRLLRGTGTRGMAGIYPKLRVAGGELQDHEPHREIAGAGAGAPHLPAVGRCGSVAPAHIIRPLLEIRRPEIEAYLHSLGQCWHEDATNRDVKYSRNRVRHVLLPLLEREFNPAIRQVLAETAEIARAEEEYWTDAVRQSLGKEVATGGPLKPAVGLSRAVRIDELLNHPLALQRRIIKAHAEQLGIALDFEQVEKVLALTDTPAGTAIELPGGWLAERRYHCVPGGSAQGAVSRSAVIIFGRISAPAGPYDYALPVPGAVQVTELGIEVRTSVVCLMDTPRSYNQGQLLDPHSLASGLRLRNWRPGDRYWPAHSKSARKVKELLQTRHISGPERSLWPVVVNPADELVWMRGFLPPERFAPSPDAREAILIEVLDGNLGGTGN